MKVGVPTEIKPDEYRVALTPAGARELSEHGHDVYVQAGAGEGSAIADSGYEAQGARIVPDAESVFGEAELVLGVKEPQASEVGLLRPEHTLFTYLHLAPAAELTRALCASGATCIAYETVEDARGRLPLLAPMSEVAGKIATQAGAHTKIDLRKIMAKRLTLTGSTLRNRSVAFKAELARSLEEAVWPVIAQARYKPLIDKIFALDDAAEAHRRIDGGEHIGKIILTVTD